MAWSLFFNSSASSIMTLGRKQYLSQLLPYDNEMMINDDLCWMDVD